MVRPLASLMHSRVSAGSQRGGSEQAVQHGGGSDEAQAGAIDVELGPLGMRASSCGGSQTPQASSVARPASATSLLEDFHDTVHSFREHAACDGALSGVQAGHESAFGEARSIGSSGASASDDASVLAPVVDSIARWLNSSRAHRPTGLCEGAAASETRQQVLSTTTIPECATATETMSESLNPSLADTVTEHVTERVTERIIVRTRGATRPSYKV